MRTHAVVFALLVNCVPAAASALLQDSGRVGAQAPQGVAVPKVTGLPLAAAQKAITGANLTPSARSMSGVAPSPEDTVVRQDPPAGQTANVKSTVVLYVAGQRPRRDDVRTAVATTPDVVGRSTQDAASIIARAEMRRGVVKTVPSQDTAFGSVLQQDPPAGSPMRPDRSIDLTVAGVPVVVGLRLPAAELVLRRVRLHVGTTTVKELVTGEGDVVLEQFPAAGQPAPQASGVNLTIARVVDRATVPKVVDLLLAAASQSLSSARVALGRVDSTDSPMPAGTVLSQSIAPGTRVPPDTTVNVTVARPPMFAMPALVGQTIASARAIIGRSGLVLGRLDIAKVEGRPDTVVNQSPSPGTRVRRGDSIMIVGGRAITPVVVPNVVGSGTNAARGVLANLGLTLVPGRGTESASPPGTILTQRPGAGTSVLRGTSVAVDTAVPRLISVPNFVGTRIDRAASLPDAGLLRLVPHDRAAQPAAVDSVVVAQSPQPNARVPIGTTIDLTVSRKQAVRLDSLRIVPDSVSLAAGDTVRMRARRFMSDGSSSDVAPTWTASAGAITSDGLYTAGSAPGRVTITASSAGVSGTAVVRVEQRQVAPGQPVPSQAVPSQAVPSAPPSSLPPRTTTPSSTAGPTKPAPTGQSPPESHVPWWLIAIGGAGVLGLGWGVWRHFHEPVPPTRATTRPPEPPPPQPSPSPPPLNFTYDYKAQEPKIELTAPQGHGSEISLVSYPGESTHAIEPASVKLFD